VKNLKDQLAGIAALVAAVVAIGGGFATYGKLTEKINVLESKSSADYSAQIAVLEEKVAAIESHEHNMAEHGHTKILVNEKEIDLLQVQIEEIKVSTSNPLAN
jgi:prophage DNA circulation protein